MISKNSGLKRRHVPGQGQSAIPLAIIDREAIEIGSVGQFNASTSDACDHNSPEQRYAR